MKKSHTSKRASQLLAAAILISGFFNTLSAQWTCGDDLVDNRDGHSYKTVLIGTQCWMAENLNYGTMVQSNAPGHQMYDNGIIEKYCWNNVADNCDNSPSHPGGYYEWQEAVQFYGGQPPLPVQGICPDGWHIPSEAEYTSLVTQLGGAAVAGGEMKQGGSSGFEGIIAGWRCTLNGGFLTLFPKGFWWTSNMQAADEGVYLDIDETNTVATIGSYPASIGFNIRCLMDGTSGTSELRKETDIIMESINQIENQIQVTFVSEYQGEFALFITDMNGRKVLQQIITCDIGENTHNIEIKRLNSGIYILRLEYKTINTSKKFYIH